MSRLIQLGRYLLKTLKLESETIVLSVPASSDDEQNRYDCGESNISTLLDPSNLPGK